MMRRYFKPWRRKFGVIALGVACLIVAMWIRSYESPTNAVDLRIRSENGALKFRGGVSLFGYAADFRPDFNPSHWSIILPVIVLSVWLLLSKPRQAPSFGTPHPSPRPAAQDQPMTYFNPWRRKIGVATLILASLFAMGWVRSLFVYEGVSVGYRTSTDQQWLVSYNSAIHWSRRADLETPNAPRKPSTILSWVSEPLPDDSLVLGSSDFEWRWQFAGCGLRELIRPRGLAHRQLSIRDLVFPYWAIAIPLTLLSAWLLLSKRRSKYQPIATT